MSDLTPTPTRLALLREVSRKNVYREYVNGQATHDLEYTSRNKRCARIGEAKRARWVELGPTSYSIGERGRLIRYWELTDAGRAVLDTHGGAS